MPKRLWGVSMPVVATTIVYVRAESAEEAVQKANDNHADEFVGLCWHCANTIDEPMVGEVAGDNALDSAWEVDEDDAREYQRAVSFVEPKEDGE